MSGKPAKPSRWKRRLTIWGGVLVVLLFLVAFLFPYILKRYIETHSEAWIDRKVTIDRIILNPFTFRYAVTGDVYKRQGPVWPCRGCARLSVPTHRALPR